MNTGVENTLKRISFTRRFFIVISFKAFFFFVIIARLFSLQIISSQKYRRISRQNKQRYSVLEGQRGIIYDSQNRIMAYNSPKNMAVFFINKSRKKEQIETLKKFVKLVYSDKPNRYKILDDFIKKLSTTKENKIVLGKHLSQKESTRLSYWEFCLPDIKKIQIFLRRYPFGSTSGNVIGYLSRQDSVSNLGFGDISLKPKNIYYLPNLYQGIHGIEKVYNDHLNSRPGLEVLDVDSSGNFLNSTIHTKPDFGKNLRLSIDAKIQDYVTKEMGNRSGACVVLDVYTGQVLSMASTPSLNSNKMISYDDDFESDPKSDLETNFIDKTIKEFYPPASTIKPIITAAAIESGISPKIRVNCTGRYRINNRYFHCHKKEGHGVVNMTDAVALSCNAFFYQLATLIKIDDVEKMVQDFGMTTGVGLEQLGIVRGKFPTSKSSVAAKQGKWTNGFTANTFIGQGFTEWTPMHMAVIAARIASGKKVDAKILFSHKKQFFEKINLKPESIEMARNCIKAPFFHEKGTLRFFKSQNQKYQMAGKTGTAQVISQNIDNKEAIKNAGSTTSSHSMFMGYAPANDPKIAISIIIEHGSFGVRSVPSALKIVRHIMDTRYPDL